MIGALIFLHRWLGVAFCLLFAMWFASGIVMHFVPYPSFTAADRRAGLAPIALAQVKALPSEALAASRIGNATRVRLMQRSDGADLSDLKLIANDRVARRRSFRSHGAIGKHWRVRLHRTTQRAGNGTLPWPASPYCRITINGHSLPN